MMRGRLNIRELYIYNISIYTYISTVNDYTVCDVISFRVWSSMLNSVPNTEQGHFSFGLLDLTNNVAWRE